MSQLKYVKLLTAEEFSKVWSLVADADVAVVEAVKIARASRTRSDAYPEAERRFNAQVDRVRRELSRLQEMAGSCEFYKVDDGEGR